jgi:hypothetical protein
VILELYHPLVANRNCQHCQEYLYREDTGEVDMDRKFAVPQPIKRPEVMPPPCRTNQGCPKGTPENSKELSNKNRLAYDHYLQCKAVGKFPEDAIVYRNAGIIRQIEDRQLRQSNSELREWIKLLVSSR